MNKKNFIINFALKSKYNFFACLVALLVLIFSVSSITYAWIEGATSLTIKGNAKVYADSGKAVKITSATSVNNTLPLAPYIDPEVVSLTPATGEVVGNEIQVKFGERLATTDDISNNYLFFEVKVQCADLVTGLAFKPGDNITIVTADDGEIQATSVKTGITLLDANRNPVISNIFSTTQINAGSLAVDGLTKDGTYILQFKIWNESTVNTYNGREVKINLNLVPQKDVATVYLKDSTNSATAQNLLSGKTVTLKSGTSQFPSTFDSTTNTYTFTDIPKTCLSSLEAVVSDGTNTYTWTLANSEGSPVKKNSTYTVYGGLDNKLGTFGAVKQVYLKDLSYENLLSTDKNIMLNNGINADAYVMYCGSSPTDFTTYVPADSVGNIITFSNANYTTSGTFNDANPYYYIFGETQTTTGGKTECLGLWNSLSNLAESVETITIKPLLTSGIDSTYSIFASYPGMGSESGVPYKAYYSSADGLWKINALNTSVNKVWTFNANNGTDSYTWNDATTNTRESADMTYTITSTTEGMWKYEGTNIDPLILTGQKVSFYVGVSTGYNSVDGLFVKTGSGKISDGEPIVGSYIGSTSNPYKHVEKDSNAYQAGYIQNVDALKYYLTHQYTWGGVQISDDKAIAGKFYGLYGNPANITTKDPVTGLTSISGKNGNDSANPVSITTNTDAVSFTTDTSSTHSLLAASADNYLNLYVEYYICETGNESQAAAYECLNPYVPGSTPTKGTLITSTSNSNNISVKDFTTTVGNTYTIKTVLTDGYVYYVTDTDYVKIVKPGTNQTVTVKNPSTVDGSVGVSVNYNGTETKGTEDGATTTVMSGEQITLKSSVQNPTFNSYSVSGITVTGETGTYSNGASYKVPERDITVSANVTRSTAQNYVIGGTSIYGLSDWSNESSYDMAYDTDPDTNSIYYPSLKVASGRTELQFKICKGDFSKRNNDADSVTVAANMSSDDLIADVPAGVEVSLTGEGKNQNVKVTGLNSSIVLTVRYYLGTGKLKVSTASSGGTLRTVTVADSNDGNGIVTMTYGGNTYSNGDSVQIECGELVTLTCAVMNGEFNSYTLSNFTQKVTGGTDIGTIETPSSQISYPIPDYDVTLSAVMQQDTSKKYYITGENIADGIGWPGSSDNYTAGLMDFNTTTNIVSKNITLTSDTAKFKLSWEGYAGTENNVPKYRDLAKYSVSVRNDFSVENNVNCTVSGLTISTDQWKNIVISGASNGTKLKISYDLTNNKVIISDASTVQTRNVSVANVDYAELKVTYPSATSDITEGGSAAVEQGKELTITLTVNDGYEYTSLKVNDVDQTYSTHDGNVYTFKYTVGSVDISIRAVVTATATPAKNTYYLKNSAGWSKVRVHYWNSSTGLTGSEWPGVEITTINSDGYYVIELDPSFANIQFNQGNSGAERNTTTAGNNGRVFDNSKNKWSDYSATPKNRIYFKDTLGWGGAYVNFYSSGKWSNEMGSGNKNITSANKQMNSLEGNDNIYYLDIPDSASACTIISFTKTSQDNYDNFWQTQAVYRSDFNTGSNVGKPMFEPSTTKSKTLNKTDYYNEGNWVASPE